MAGKVKLISDIETFEDIIDESKAARKDIYLDGRKLDKRKNITDDMEDVFDNKIQVSYSYEGGNLYIERGTNKTTEVVEDWSYFENVLPEDGQNITVFDEGQNKELKRTFYLEFWKDHGRVTWCSQFTKKWRPRSE